MKAENSFFLLRLATNKKTEIANADMETGPFCTVAGNVNTHKLPGRMLSNFPSSSSLKMVFLIMNIHIRNADFCLHNSCTRFRKREAWEVSALWPPQALAALHPAPRGTVQEVGVQQRGLRVTHAEVRLRLRCPRLSSAQRAGLPACSLSPTLCPRLVFLWVSYTEMCEPSGIHYQC